MGFLFVFSLKVTLLVTNSKMKLQKRSRYLIWNISILNQPCVYRQSEIFFQNWFLSDFVAHDYNGQIYLLTFCFWREILMMGSIKNQVMSDSWGYWNVRKQKQERQVTRFGCWGGTAPRVTCWSVQRFPGCDQGRRWGSPECLFLEKWADEPTGHGWASAVGNVGLCFWTAELYSEWGLAAVGWGSYSACAR